MGKSEDTFSRMIDDIDKKLGPPPGGSRTEGRPSVNPNRLYPTYGTKVKMKASTCHAFFKDCEGTVINADDWKAPMDKKKYQVILDPLRKVPEEKRLILYNVERDEIYVKGYDKKKDKYFWDE